MNPSLNCLEIETKCYCLLKFGEVRQYFNSDNLKMKLLVNCVDDQKEKAYQMMNMIVFGEDLEEEKRKKGRK